MAGIIGRRNSNIAHNKTGKTLIRKKVEKQRQKLYFKSKLDKVNVLKELYKLIQEVSSLYSIFIFEVKFKITRKQSDTLSEKAENVKIEIIEKLSMASMLIEFYADENKSIFFNYQKVLLKGFKIWEDYKLINRFDKNFVHRYSRAQLDIIGFNTDKVKEHELLLRKQIGKIGRNLISTRSPYEGVLEELSVY